MFILNNYLCHVVGEMLTANGGYVKSLVSDEKSLGNIWWNGKYFVTLHREFSLCNPPRGMPADRARNPTIGNPFRRAVLHKIKTL